MFRFFERGDWFNLQVVSNTTVSRPDSILGLLHAEETGGLSGKPLYNMATEVLRDMYILTKVCYHAFMLPGRL